MLIHDLILEDTEYNKNYFIDIWKNGHHEEFMVNIKESKKGHISLTHLLLNKPDDCDILTLNNNKEITRKKLLKRINL